MTIKNLLAISFILILCTNGLSSERREVVIYTALDQVYSEPILKQFEAITGIHTKAVYDIEAAKTTGLVNRLIAEKKNPQCDVFWNNEVVRSIILKRKGVLANYRSSVSRDIPAQFKDKDGYWTGFAARARVLVVNTELLKVHEYPKSIFDLTSATWKGKAAIANPLFGTTATHVAALFSSIGEQAAKQFLVSLKKNKISIVDGNSVVKDQVGAGELLVGFTDTDDVNMGIQSGLPIKAIFPDKDGMGTLLIPNTVCLVKNGPNIEEGKQLIDFLLSKKVEEQLASSKSVQMPLRDDVKTPGQFVSIKDIEAMDVDFEKVSDIMNSSISFVQDIFIR
jgi:iron(III) transport system substrate-binding protein